MLSPDNKERIGAITRRRAFRNIAGGTAAAAGALGSLAALGAYLEELGAISMKQTELKITTNAFDPVLKIPTTTQTLEERRATAKATSEAHQAIAAVQIEIDKKHDPIISAHEWRKWTLGLPGISLLVGGGILLFKANPITEKSMGTLPAPIQDTTDIQAPISPEVNEPRVYSLTDRLSTYIRFISRHFGKDDGIPKGIREKWGKN